MSGASGSGADREFRSIVGARTIREEVLEAIATIDAMGEPAERVVVSRDPETGRVDVAGPYTPVQAEAKRLALLQDFGKNDLANVEVFVGYWQADE